MDDEDSDFIESKYPEYDILDEPVNMIEDNDMEIQPENIDTESQIENIVDATMDGGNIHSKIIVNDTSHNGETILNSKSGTTPKSNDETFGGTIIADDSDDMIVETIETDTVDFVKFTNEILNKFM
jgi:hypothetical protein